jgi:hypothetical protein
LIVEKNPGEKSWTAQTDKTGMAIFESLEPGTYDVIVKSGKALVICSTATVGKSKGVETSSKEGTTIRPIALKENTMVRVVIVGL